MHCSAVDVEGLDSERRHGQELLHRMVSKVVESSVVLRATVYSVNRHGLGTKRWRNQSQCVAPTPRVPQVPTYRH